MSRHPDVDSRQYPGPSPAELGTLASLFDASGPTRTQTGWSPTRTFPIATDRASDLGPDSESYSGPTPEELGDLSTWLDNPRTPRRTQVSSVLRPRKSAEVPSDPVLDQLDAIEIELRKRPIS